MCFFKSPMDGFFVAAVAGLGAALLLIAAAEVILKFHNVKATISHIFVFQFLTVLRSCTMAVGCEFLMSEKTKATTDPGLLQKGRNMGKKYEKKIQPPTLHMFLIKRIFSSSGCYL